MGAQEWIPTSRMGNSGALHNLDVYAQKPTVLASAARYNDAGFRRRSRY